MSSFIKGKWLVSKRLHKYCKGYFVNITAAVMVYDYN